MSDQSVVSVVALEIAQGKEREFLSLAGQLQALVCRKGYGTNQLLRDGSHPRRYYDIRIWRNAEAAAKAAVDKEIEDLSQQLGRNLRATPMVDLAWAVEMGLASAGPWQERRTGSRRMNERPQPKIVEAARIARGHAEVPFSHFKVGAALETSDGRIVTGCNVESATYGLTMCAERVAVFKAVSEGHRSFTRIAIVADAKRPISPCGACRQVLWELGGNLEIILADLHTINARHRLKDLLPHPFDALFLE